MSDDIKDRIKKYWNAQPCNIKHGTAEFGSADFFQQVSERRYRVEPHIAEFAGFHLWQGRRVLEVGCGIASDGEEFAKHGAEYVGIDYSDQSVEIAKSRFQTLGLEGNFYNIDASDAEAMASLGQFDLVYSYGVIHHYPDIETIVKNVHSVLKPGGEFRFMVYARNSWKQAMIYKGLDQYEAQAGCPYAKSFTREEIPALLGTGWQLERVRQDHCFMYNVEAYKQGRYELDPWFAAMPDAMREAVREYLGWHLLVKAKKI